MKEIELTYDQLFKIIASEEKIHFKDNKEYF